MTDRLLTAREVAGHLGVATETVLRWHRSGRLPGGYRLATGVLRFDPDEIDRWLEERREDCQRRPGDVELPSALPGQRPLQTIAPAEQEGTDAR